MCIYIYIHIYIYIYTACVGRGAPVGHELGVLQSRLLRFVHETYILGTSYVHMITIIVLTATILLIPIAVYI